MKKFLLIVAVLAFAQWWFKDPSISIPEDDVSLGYIVKYTGENGRNDNLPMLVALHGNGDTAKHFYETALDLVKTPARIVLLKGPLSYSGGDAWPYKAEDLSRYGNAVNEAVGQLALKYPTQGKPVLLGFSGGAIMAYYQAVKYGNSYSYILPVSGELSEALLGDESANPGAGVHAYHGKSDSVISFGSGKNAVKLLQAKGVRATLTEFAGNHLGIFTDMKPEITQAIEEKLAGLK